MTRRELPSASVSLTGRSSSDGLTTSTLPLPDGSCLAMAASACLRGLAIGDHAVEFFSAVGVDLGDRGARQDVVELVLQHDAPFVLQRSRFLAAHQMRQPGRCFRRDQAAFGLAVQALDDAPG